jgi:putative ABC transport system permease protein
VIPPAITLAGWRLRQVWRLLLVCGVGVLAASVIACTVPLYTQVALNAGIHNVLTATPDATQLQLEGRQFAVSVPDIAKSKAVLSSFMQSQLGSYLASTSQFTFETANVPLVSADPALQQVAMALTGITIPQAGPHLHLLSGQLPTASGGARTGGVGAAPIEVALTQQTANLLHATVGSIVRVELRGQLVGGATGESVPFAQPLPLSVVGIIAPPGNDLFWHGADFQPEVDPNTHITSIKGVMSADAFVAALTQIAHQQGGSAIILADPLVTEWYFYLNAPRVTTDTLDDVIARLNASSAQLSLAWGAVYSLLDPTAPPVPFLSGPAVELYGAPSSLERFRDWVGVMQLPLGILAAQIVALLLFFVVQMAALLIERQADALALMRSRGARRRHIFGAFAVQCLGLALLALLAAPALGLLLTRLLSQMTFAADAQGALAATLGDPAHAMQRVLGFAALAAGSVALAMALTAAGAAGRDVLAVRREAARTARRPLWQRLQLDLVAAVIALTGYGVSLYLTSSTSLDAHTLEVLATPLDLIGPTFLLLAGVLLFLRVFPLLLRLFAWMAAHRPSAPPMLALAQMARAPAAAVRLILLLALAVGFAGFSLTFSASEQQRIAQIATQQVGADFSGTLPTSATAPTMFVKPGTVELPYQAITGVRAASAGIVTDANAYYVDTSAPSVMIQAVDTGTFARTGIWSHDDASQSLSSLFAELRNSFYGYSGTNIVTQDGVPALVDAVAWNGLHLFVGAQFTLSSIEFSVPIPFVAVAEVRHIPAINDSIETNGAGGYATPGGILVDFAMLSKVYHNVVAASEGQSLSPSGQNVSPPPAPFLAPNHLWLRTSGDTATLARVRAKLSAGSLRLLGFQDRRALTDHMLRDPLYRALVGVLALGTITTLLLALAGTLLASWLYARSRLTTFALLRALGSDPRRIASVLAWEQGIIYTVALALGGIIGALLALTGVPGLLFANPDTPSNPVNVDAVYVIQRVLPPQIVPPITLGIGCVLLVAICAATLALMARIVSKPSIKSLTWRWWRCKGWTWKCCRAR